MRQALMVLAATFGSLELILDLTGHATAWRVGFGAISLMGAMIAVTFLWLWAARATPLALGMAFSWAGSASVMGWWWLYDAMGRPPEMDGHRALFAFLSLCITGAGLHFAVIQRSLGVHPALFAAPVAVALALAGLVIALG